MASKLVTDRQKGADAVAAVGKAQASEIAKAAPGVGETVPHLVEQLETARDEMVAADAAHEEELADDPGERDARDQAASTLGSRLIELREIISGLFGAATERKLFAGRTPQDPVVLSRFAGEVASLFEKVKLPTPRLPGVKLDTAGLAQELRGLRAALDQRIEAVAREVREAQVTLEAKNRAIAAYDRVFGSVATVLSGLLELGGHAELAAKVRPSSRRPGQTVEQEEQESAGADDADTEASAED